MKVQYKDMSISYASADVGVLMPPNYIARYKQPSDAELEDKFVKINKDIDSKQRHTTFASEKNTPIIAKIILACLGIFATVLLGKAIFKFKK